MRIGIEQVSSSRSLEQLPSLTEKDPAGEKLQQRTQNSSGRQPRPAANAAHGAQAHRQAQQQ